MESARSFIEVEIGDLDQCLDLVRDAPPPGRRAEARSQASSDQRARRAVCQLAVAQAIAPCRHHPAKKVLEARF